MEGRRASGVTEVGRMRPLCRVIRKGSVGDKNKNKRGKTSPRRMGQRDEWRKVLVWRVWGRGRPLETGEGWLVRVCGEERIVKGK